MGQATAAQVRQPKIIERPRLTRQLDECGARVILLVAPAGYGKTTLARQWLAQKPSSWYRCNSASADIAAFAMGLAGAASRVITGAGDRMKRRLAASTSDRPDAQVLGEMLLADLGDWPRDCWLVVDDYHLALANPETDQLLEQILQSEGVNLLVTSRTQPRWGTVRQTLTGQQMEIGHEQLAMTHAEAIQLVDDERVVELAAGWPALLLLARIRGASGIDAPTSDALHRYLAQELFEDLPDDLRIPLCVIALCPNLPLATYQSALGATEANRVLEAGDKRGLLSRVGETVEMHPLIRNHLTDRLINYDATSAASGLLAVLLDDGQWDNAFELIETAGMDRDLERLVELCLPSLFSSGRHATLERWMAYAEARRLSSPVLLYAEAELATRRGNQARAASLALQAAKELPAGHPHEARAWIVAGRAAHLSDDFDLSLERHAEAELRARTPSDLADAVWGAFISAAQVDTQRCLQLVERIEQLDDKSIEGTLRFANASYHKALRSGSLADLEALMQQGFQLLDKGSDPLRATSFLNTYARWLCTQGRYDAALSASDRLITLVEDNRLPFALPSVLTTRSCALLGRRDLAGASRALDAAQELARELGDGHNKFDAHLLRTRLLLMRNDFESALNELDEVSESPKSSLLAQESDAHRALVLACTGQSSDVRDLLSRVHSDTSDVDALLCGARAISALVEGQPALAEIRRLTTLVQERGIIDGLVTVYRSYPAILEHLGAQSGFEAELKQILVAAHDQRLAQANGIAIAKQREQSPLSPREREVHELVSQGLTNRQIAGLLFIEETTVKAHIRHIFEKLGVRTRVEAATRDA